MFRLISLALVRCFYSSFEPNSFYSLGEGSPASSSERLDQEPDIPSGDILGGRAPAEAGGALGTPVFGDGFNFVMSSLSELV